MDAAVLMNEAHVGADGSIVLDDAVAATAVEGRPCLRDEALSSDGRFLYAIGRIFALAVGEAGDLTDLGSWEGLPETVAGLAAS